MFKEFFNGFDIRDINFIIGPLRIGIGVTDARKTA